MKAISAMVSTVVLAIVSNNAFAGDFSGILKSQTSYGSKSDKLQQQEWLLDMEYNTPFFGGDITAIGRLRWDSVDDLSQKGSSRPKTYSPVGGPITAGPSGEIDVRELYWEKATNTTYWRVGKQQVVWGEADGLKLLDVINPQSFREFILDDFDDSRIPLWMINAELNVTENSVLQILWIPDTSTHELAPSSSPFAFTSPALVPQLPSGVSAVVNDANAPTSLLKDSDFGMRFTNFVGGWDISLNYLYHYVDTPVIRSRLAGVQVVVEQDYERSHLVGGTASTALGDWTLRTEIAYETNRYHRTVSTFPGVSKADQLGSVIGLDWQGWTDQFISFQWFQTTITESTPALFNNRHENRVTFLWESKFLNETLTGEWLHIHSLDHGDGVFQPKLTYNYQANIDIYVGVDVFYGDNDELFGQFDQADRITIGINWGF
tara:strand:+ start:6991 stop:8292 length:1302 start_codon:yes stop_codon:yes gene_type:complete